MNLNNLIKRYRINQVEATPALDFECFPFKVHFDIPGNQVSFTMDNKYFSFVNRAVIEQLHDNIMADLSKVKYSKVDRQFSNLVYSILSTHIHELQATNPAFDAYVVSNQIL